MEALFGSSNPAAMLGGVFGLFVILFLLVLGILWFIFPFAVFGVKPLLRQLIATDEGSARLGEVALVPFDSPISRSGILFFNTLFDENAACHLALGKAYPTCLQGGEAMDSVTLLQHGVNDSLIHEDFMIGSRDLSITGITQDGQEVPVFRNGNFVEF